MQNRFIVVLGLLISIFSATAFGDEVGELCKQKRAEYQNQLKVFEKLEKEPSDRLALPPLYQYACRGHALFADRDARQEQAANDYAEKLFLHAEMKIVGDTIEAARGVALTCESVEDQNAVDDVTLRAGQYLLRRLNEIVEKAMAEPGNDKVDRFTPLIRAMMALDRERQRMNLPMPGDSEGKLAAAPLAQALFFEYVRRLRDDHDYQVTPSVLIRLSKEAATTGADVPPHLADPKSLLESLWRFKVTFENLLQVESEGRKTQALVDLRDYLMTMNLNIVDRSQAGPTIPYFDPTAATLTYQYFNLDKATFVGPSTFSTNLDLDFDPCVPDPGFNFFITRFGASQENFTVQSPRGPMPISVPGMAHNFASGLLLKRTEFLNWRELPSYKFKLRMNAKNVTVVDEVITETDTENGGVAIDEMKVKIVHAPVAK